MDEEQPAKATRLLRSIATHLEDEANKVSDTLAKQLVVLDSGALAILSVNSANPPKPELTEQILLTTATILVGISLIAVIVMYMQIHAMARNGVKKVNEINEIISDHDEQTGAITLQKMMKKVSFGAGFIAYWISAIAFLAAALVIAVLVLLKIW